jgi:hypothetical protein
MSEINTLFDLYKTISAIIVTSALITFCFVVMIGLADLGIRKIKSWKK